MRLTAHNTAQCWASEDNENKQMDKKRGKERTITCAFVLMSCTHRSSFNIQVRGKQKARFNRIRHGRVELRAEQQADRTCSPASIPYSACADVSYC